MGPSRIPLTLDASLCDHCGKCVPACGPGALRVGPSYLFVDWEKCDGCLACAKLCGTGAIEASAARSAPSRPAVDTRPAPAARPRASSGPLQAPEWTLLEAWLLLAVLFVAFLGKDALMTSAAVQGLSSEAQVFARVAVLFGFYGVQAAVLCALAWRRGLGVADAFRLRTSDVSLKSRLEAAALVVGMLVVVRVGAWAYGALVQEFGWDPPVREVADLTEVFGPTVWGLLLSVALVVIVAPLVEEVVFRGVLQSAFAARWDWRLAIALSAALFALYHMTLWLFVPLFALGVACGWLARTRETLLPAVSLHGAYNVLPVVIAFWMVW